MWPMRQKSREPFKARTIFSNLKPQHSSPSVAATSCAAARCGLGQTLRPPPILAYTLKKGGIEITKRRERTCKLVNEARKKAGAAARKNGTYLYLYNRVSLFFS